MRRASGPWNRIPMRRESAEGACSYQPGAKPRVCRQSQELRAEGPLHRVLRRHRRTGPAHCLLDGDLDLASTADRAGAEANHIGHDWLLILICSLSAFTVRSSDSMLQYCSALPFNIITWSNTIQETTARPGGAWNIYPSKLGLWIWLVRK